jgi:pantetheine-phosphate adenylyltransferase
MSEVKIQKAVYAGSFDPVTNGHLWMIKEGVRLFDHLTVALGTNPDKNYTFSVEERMEMLTESLPPETNLSIEHFHNRYLVDYAASLGAEYILRGIRSSDDYEYEKVMRHINSDMREDVTTVFLMPPREIAEVSSSMAKGMIGPDGWEGPVSEFVPKGVLERLVRRFSEDRQGPTQK